MEAVAQAPNVSSLFELFVLVKLQLPWFAMARDTHATPSWLGKREDSGTSWEMESKKGAQPI